ncbi:MAG: DUF1295 domain-containing protein [Candidatus Woesearchaeota archaeon]
MIEILYALIISLAIQIIMFIPAFIFKTDKLTDISYGLTFIILTVAMFFFRKNSIYNAHKNILLLMVVFWGLRLAVYLFLRIRKIKKDKRFDGIRESFSKFLFFWLIQGASVWIILLPVQFFILSDSNIAVSTIAGFILWLAGFVVEAVSDMQKYRFIKKPENKDKWIATGLWKYSRHPNYFGEILCWIGVYLYCFSSLTPDLRIISLISPVYIAFLIIFVSGLPKLEAGADRKWGSVGEYKLYKKRTSILLPWFVKK